jgi:hypothetical protein
MTDYGPDQNPGYPKPRWWWKWVIGVVASFVLLFLLVAIFLPTYNPPHSTAPKVESANNLKQIGLAIQLYTKDSGGKYPDTFGTLLLTQDITSAVFVSPESQDTPAAGPTPNATVADLTAGGHLSYVYLGRGLSGDVPDDVVVAYENPTIWPNGTNVLYANGFVAFERHKSVIRRIIDRAAAGIFPVTRSSAP